MKKIGIMGAMPDEIKILKSNLLNTKSEMIAGVEFVSGDLNNRHVTVCCAGMGKVNAAAAAQILISVYGSECIIFTGIAGNTSPEISVGDVVIGNEVCYHDAELNMISQSYPNTNSYMCDEALVKIADDVCSKMPIKYKIGKIATGDLFIADEKVKDDICNRCAPSCVEMEGAAVGHVCAKNDVPFVVIRVMSDDCSEEAADKLIVKQFDITEYVDTASNIVREMVLHI